MFVELHSRTLACGHFLTKGNPTQPLGSRSQPRGRMSTSAAAEVQPAGNRPDCEAQGDRSAPREMHDEEELSSIIPPEGSEDPLPELIAKGSGEIEAEAALAYEEAIKNAKSTSEVDMDDSMEFSFQFPEEPNVRTDGEGGSSCQREHAAAGSSPTPNGACALIVSPMDDDVFSYPQESLSSTPSHLAPLTPPVLSHCKRPLPFKYSKSPIHSLSEDNGCQSIIICGRAGSNKHAFADKMIVDSPAVFTKVIQHTTRAPLQNEVEGKDFHFVTKEMGLRMMDEGELAEYIFLKPEEKRNRYNADSLRDQRSHRETVRIDSPPRTPTIPSSPMMSGGRHANVLYGTSYRAIREARMKGPKCIVLVVSVEGGIQLREKGLAGQYILFTTQEEGDLMEVKQALKPDVVIDISDDPYSILLHKAISFVETAVTHTEAVYFTTQAQWEAVPEMVASPKGVKRSPSSGGTFTSFITYAQVLQHFQVTDMSTELTRIQPEVQYSGLKAVTHKVFGPPKITGRRLKQERDLVFAIAQHKLDYTEPLHSSVLQTIFKKLTGGNEMVDCPRFGSHWEVIGFQGSDPATDLRATGFLSLCHLLYLVDVKDRLTLAHKIYQLSKSSHNPFPFCVLCINTTRIALSALREGYLTKECRRQGAVISVVSHFFVATLFYYYETYRQKQLTFHELGDFLHNVESHCKKNVHQVMYELDAALAALGGGAAASRHWAMPSRQQEVEEEDSLQFTDILSVGTETH